MTDDLKKILSLVSMIGAAWWLLELADKAHKQQAKVADWRGPKLGKRAPEATTWDNPDAPGTVL